MLQKSYSTLLNFYTGFKTNLKTVIYDIDERLRGIENGTTLADTYAPLEHTHEQYSLMGHIHNHQALISPFVTPNTTSGSVTITTDFQVKDYEYYVIKGDEYFTFNTSTSNSITLDYEFPSGQTDNSFALLYWRVNASDEVDQSDVVISINDAYLVEDEPLTATCSVAYADETPLNGGKVTLYIDDTKIKTYTTSNGQITINETLSDYTIGTKQGKLVLKATEQYAKTIKEFNITVMETLQVTVPDTEENNLRLIATVTDADTGEEVTEGDVTFTLQRRSE